MVGTAGGAKSEFRPTTHHRSGSHARHPAEFRPGVKTNACTQERCPAGQQKCLEGWSVFPSSARATADRSRGPSRARTGMGSDDARHQLRRDSRRAAAAERANLSLRRGAGLISRLGHPAVPAWHSRKEFFLLWAFASAHLGAHPSEQSPLNHCFPTKLKQFASCAHPVRSEQCAPWRRSKPPWRYVLWGGELMIVAGAIRAGAGPPFAARPKSKEGVSGLQVKTRQETLQNKALWKTSQSVIFGGVSRS